MSSSLTKSLYKIASDCPAKLYYHVNNAVYANNALHRPFLAELAKGGFQVGALARCYYPQGILIPKGDRTSLVEKTLQLLKSGDVTLFEAAIAVDDFYIRVDILEKRDSKIRLIEVKAKSFSPLNDRFINTRNGEISSKWRNYLEDVAFQAFVMNKFIERYKLNAEVTPFLMLANKDTTTNVEGLNQLFFFNKSTREVELDTRVIVDPSSVGNNILREVNVRDEVRMIHEEPYPEGPYEAHVNHIARALKNNEKLAGTLSKECKKCEYQQGKDSIALKDGLQECWKELAGFDQKDFERKMAWDVWMFKRSEDMIRNGRYFLDQVTRNDLDPNGNSRVPPNGMSLVERQEMQVTKHIAGDITPYVLRDELCREMTQWKFPLNMIDFETSAVALPFHAGMRPYETIAFQFSHHLVHRDGRVEHANEWLQPESGKFPNFDFIRALKKALSENEGTIFRYSSHENTVLNTIHRQLASSDEPDRDDLQRFIEDITCLWQKKPRRLLRSGTRCMVDLLEVVKSYYYHPLAGGSNSLKYILPAVLNTSDFLQKKYSLPLYGTREMPSKNFTNTAWIERIDGKVADPYDMLPPIFDKHDDALLEKIVMDEDAELQEGGAAMAAFAMMQFSRMSDAEAQRIRESLLRYCELDTLAMVMLYEELRVQCN